MSSKALFSLNDVSRAAEFGGALSKLGWKIIATAETVSVLEQAGIECQSIESFVGIDHDYGIPPTLHPRIENALTMEESPDRIDLVYDLPYPLEVGNDVGGRVILALAAKGERLPVMSHDDMEAVIGTLQSDGSVPDGLRATLIERTNAEIARHYLGLVGQMGRSGYAGLIGEQAYTLMNGENPYQKAELYATDRSDPLALANFELLSETLPCFTNLADLDNIIQTLCLGAAAFDAEYGKVPFIVVTSKHGNPCGMSVSWDDPAACIEQALWGNPVAIWGGECVTNFAIDDHLAERLVRSARREERLGTAGWMLDVVAAPRYEGSALEILKKRKFRKVYRNEGLLEAQLNAGRHTYRAVRGGFMRQFPAWQVLRFDACEAAGKLDDPVGVDSLLVAWAVAFTSFHGGNEIALARQRGLIGAGGGPSTVQAAQVAVDRAREAGHDTRDSIFCADAFFPFTDAPQILIDARVRLGCVPAGGQGEPQVRELFADNDVGMLYLPEELRGFCRH